MATVLGSKPTEISKELLAKLDLKADLDTVTDELETKADKEATEQAFLYVATKEELSDGLNTKVNILDNNDAMSLKANKEYVDTKLSLKFNVTEATTLISNVGLKAPKLNPTFTGNVTLPNLAHIFIVEDADASPTLQDYFDAKASTVAVGTIVAGQVGLALGATGAIGVALATKLDIVVYALDNTARNLVINGKANTADVNTALTQVDTRLTDITTDIGTLETSKADKTTVELNIGDLTTTVTANMTSIENLETFKADIIYVDSNITDISTTIASNTSNIALNAPKLNPTFTGDVNLPGTTNVFFNDVSLSNILSTNVTDLTSVNDAIALNAPKFNPTFTGDVNLPDTSNVFFNDVSLSNILTENIADLTTIQSTLMHPLYRPFLAPELLLDVVELFADILTTKAPLIEPTFTGNVNLPDTTNVFFNDISLSNILTENTTDLTAVNEAIALNAPKFNPTFTGDVNLPDTQDVFFNDVSLSNILSTNVTDLTSVNEAIALKAPKFNPTFTGGVNLPDTQDVFFNDVSLSNILTTNVPDLTAIQSNIDTKAPLIDPTFTGDVHINEALIVGETSISGFNTTSGDIACTGDIFVGNTVRVISGFTNQTLEFDTFLGLNGLTIHGQNVINNQSKVMCSEVAVGTVAGISATGGVSCSTLNLAGEGFLGLVLEQNQGQANKLFLGEVRIATAIKDGRVAFETELGQLGLVVNGENVVDRFRKVTCSEVACETVVACESIQVTTSVTCEELVCDSITMTASDNANLPDTSNVFFNNVSLSNILTENIADLTTIQSTLMHPLYRPFLAPELLLDVVELFADILTTKAPLIDPTFTGNVNLPDTSNVFFNDVSLSNILTANITDLTSVNDAIALNAPSSNPTFDGNVNLPDTSNVFFNEVSLSNILALKASLTDSTFLGDVNFPSASNVKFDNIPLSTLVGAGTPLGAIIIWSGSLSTIPDGWKLCDGIQSPFSGVYVPDLRMRFVVGAGGDNPSVSGDGFTFGHTSLNKTVIEQQSIQPTVRTITQVRQGNAQNSGNNGDLAQLVSTAVSDDQPANVPYSFADANYYFPGPRGGWFIFDKIEESGTATVTFTARYRIQEVFSFQPPGYQLWRWMSVGGVETYQLIEELVTLPNATGVGGDWIEGYFTPHTADYNYGDIVVWFVKAKPAPLGWEPVVEMHHTNGMKIVTTFTTMPATTSETTTITIPHYALCYIIRIAFDSGETFTENTPDEFLTAVDTLSTNVNTLSSTVTAFGNDAIKRSDTSFNLRKPIVFDLDGRTDTSPRHPFIIMAWGFPNHTMIEFRNESKVVGSIVTNRTNTSYNTSSDYRLKTVISPIADASMRLLALKPIRFAWKSTGDEVDGFLAHEAQEIVPECVTGEKDAVNEDGTPEYQGIDQSKIVPLLVASLQDALKRIAVLEKSL